MTTPRPSRSSPAVRVSDDGGRRVYTRRLRTLHAALVLLSGTVLAVGPTSEFVVGNHVLAAAVAGVVFAAALLCSVGLLRRAIVVTPGQVAVRGLCTSRRFRAEEVARFEPPESYGKVFGRVALRIVLVDGRVRHAGVFANSRLDGDGVGVEECAELNRWLALQSGSGASSESLPGRRPDPPAVRVAWWAWLTLLAAFALFCLTGVVLEMTDPAFGA